jgi:hypothetical protein
MSTMPAASRSSAARTRRHRQRQREGTRCVTVAVNLSERDALVVRGEAGAGIARALRSSSAAWPEQSL